MTLPPNFLEIWNRYEDELGEDETPAWRSAQLNAARKRELQALGVDLNNLAQRQEVDRALGGGDYRLYGVTQAVVEAGEVQGSDRAGNPVLWNPRTGTSRPAGPVYQGADPRAVPQREEPAPVRSGGAAAAPGGQRPPAPGASYAGMSVDGKTVRWYMPDGTIQFTNAQGSTTGIPQLPASAQTGTRPSAPTAPPVDRATLPSPVGGMTNAEYDRFKAQASSALSGIGIVDYTPTDSEIASFFHTGFDVEGIANYYRTDPTFVARQPGLPYGLSREDYRGQRSEIERFAVGLGADAGATDPTHANEPEYIGEAFREKMGAQETEAGLADEFRRLGKSKATAEDVRGFRTRPTVKTADDRAGPAGRVTPLGPTTGIGGPGQNYVGPRRG